MDRRTFSPAPSLDTMDPYNPDLTEADINTKTKTSSYVRYPKPPYTYLGLAVMAIELSSSKSLILSDIIDSVSKMFPFFRENYTGWKASLRHTLSKYDCFNRTTNGEWTVDLTKVQSSAFRRQDTAVAREGNYAFDLHRELGVPRVKLPSDIKNMPTSKFDSSSDSSHAMSPEILVDGSPEKSLTNIATAPMSVQAALRLQPTSNFMKVEQSTSSLRTTSSIPALWTPDTAACSTTVSSTPHNLVPINYQQYMKKSPAWSPQDTRQPRPMISSEIPPPSSPERSSCMQHLVPTSNPFFAGTAEDISPNISMPTLSPIWNTVPARDDDSDNSFTHCNMPDLTPVWKILSQSISTDASSEYRAPLTPPITLSDLTTPIGASTPLDRKATSILRLPFRTTPDNQTTKFLMDDILGERDGPADRPLAAKSTSPTQSSPSKIHQSMDVALAAVTSEYKLPDCPQNETPVSWLQHSSQPHHSLTDLSRQMPQEIPLYEFPTDAPGKAPKRKRTNPTRKMNRSPKAAHGCPSTTQNESQNTAIDNLQRICQNFNFNTNPFVQSSISQPPVPANFGHVFPAASATAFHYPQQQSYANYPYAGYCNPHPLTYQTYQYMQLPHDASSHFPMMHPYFTHAYTAQRPETQPVDLSSTRGWWTH